MASAKTYYARPVLVRGNKDRAHSIMKQAPDARERTKSSSSSPGIPVRSRSSDLGNTPPPPRPPPPRPERAPKHRILPPTPETPKSSSAEFLHSCPVPSTPEPKPLTRTNVTKHDGIWQREQDEKTKTGQSDILSPPLKYITPQAMEEKLRNFDPLDVLDSASDHSDSSADTMIMMTTEEEKKNTEKINHSLKEYKSVKFKDDIPNTNKLKLNMQNAKSVLNKYKDSNGRVPIKGVPLSTINGEIDITDNHGDISSKFTPLHIKTDHMNGSESVSNKTGGHHGSPHHDDSPDDGYGTNSSSGTVSSPFSSSFNSTMTDLDHSNGSGVKGAILPNGAIKPNSVRENWAVKRKQRMIEAQDNSVQEQLRHLTRIEEEASSSSGNILQSRHSGRNVNILQPDDVSGDTMKDKNKLISKVTPGVRNEHRKLPPEPKIDGEPPFINVSQNEIAHRNRQLYVRDSESDSLRVQTLPARLGTRQAGLQPEPTNEINVPPPIPAHRNVPTRRHYSSSSAERIYDKVYEPANHVHRQINGQMNHPGSTNNHVRVEDARFYSIASQDSVESAPLMLKTVADQQVRTPNGSGNIYVSPAGDEGCYSLNRSWSNASFQPITEVDETALPADLATAGPVPSSPQSPLEQISGDLLEKWSDMDRNYRNYYGFEEQYEKYTRTDSKINYFQEKKINNLYGHDNHYQPHGYSQTNAASSVRQEPTNQGRGNDSVPTNQNSKTSASDGQKTHSGSKNKFFQILPNMFKPSNKKQNPDKSAKSKVKSKGMPVMVEPTAAVEQKDIADELESEAEYVNMSDLPQYSMANIIHEEYIKKGKCVPMETLQRRPVFASSKDIQKLFSLHDQSFDSINSPGSQRHSFHAMPLSYRHMNRDGGNSEDMRPRAQSTSATMRSQTMRTTVDNRMSVLYNKNVTLSQRLQVNSASSVGNLSAHSNSSGPVLPSSRTRLDSGSSGGDSKLSTLV